MEAIEVYKKIYELKKAKKLLKKHGILKPAVESDLVAKEKDYAKLKEKEGKDGMVKNK